MPAGSNPSAANSIPGPRRTLICTLTLAASGVTVEVGVGGSGVCVSEGVWMGAGVEEAGIGVRVASGVGIGLHAAASITSATEVTNRGNLAGGYNDDLIR